MEFKKATLRPMTDKAQPTPAGPLIEVQINPASLRLSQTNSLDVGKDGDISIWDRDPLSSYAKVEKTIIDGEVYFDSSLPRLGLTHWKDAPMSGSDFDGSEMDEMGIGEAH